MAGRRIERKTSRTAEMTCLSRAASAFEIKAQLKCGDHLAVALLPDPFRRLVHLSVYRRFHRRVLAPEGAYEYVIARTKYIDGVLERALTEGLDQVLIFGAGFDTRALRFQERAQQVRFFELDAPATQRAKIGQYQRRGLALPGNLVFVEVDFDKESLGGKLDGSGFKAGLRTLFVLEGVLMYLESESVEATLRTIQHYSGAGSRLVFDYVLSSVISQAEPGEREARLRETVAKFGEQWKFGIEPSQVGPLMEAHGFALVDHRQATDLEEMYFRDEAGDLVGRVNPSHGLALAVSS